MLHRTAAWGVHLLQTRHQRAAGRVLWLHLHQRAAWRVLLHYRTTRCVVLLLLLHRQRETEKE